MLTNRIAVGVLACSFLGVFSVGALHSQTQTYPNFNGGKVINNDTSGGPVRMGFGPTFTPDTTPDT